MVGAIDAQPGQVVEVKHSKNTVLSKAIADADISINNINEAVKIFVPFRIFSSQVYFELFCLRIDN